jgi:predicted phosphohydrolase
VSLVLLSDTHGHHRGVAVPDGDVLVFAGDYGMRATPGETAEFNRWLAALPHPHKLLVAGNHDQGPLGELGRLLPAATVLTDAEAMVEVGGRRLRVWGAPWQPQFAGWPTYLPARQALAHWRKVPAGLDILLTHTPPWKYGDGDEAGLDGGDPGLLEAIRRARPRLAVFGHIHNGLPRAGLVPGTAATTEFVNAALTNNSALLAHAPTVYVI